MTTYGFIGAGNMAGAIVRGLLAAGVDPAEVLVSAGGDLSAQRLAEQTGTRHCEENAAAVRGASIVVLAVKPQVLPAVAKEIGGVWAEHSPLAVSIAAGTTVRALEGMLPAGARVIRTMPNMNAQIGKGITALTAGTTASREDVAAARHLFSAVGGTVELAEKDFATFTAIAGCSPAWAFTFIDALARAAVKHGLPRAQAVEIASHALAGSGALALERAEVGPVGLAEAVCSPGGTSIAGLLAMEAAGFSSAVVAAVDAAIARDRELGASGGAGHG